MITDAPTTAKKAIMRTIKVWFDDGDHLVTSINGTDQEIIDHYIGHDFEVGGDVKKHKAVLVEFIMTKTFAGIWAKSIESGWKGQVIAIEEFNGDVMYKMVGICWLSQVVGGQTLEEAISSDDIQWFSPYDVRYIRRPQGSLSQESLNANG